MGPIFYTFCTFDTQGLHHLEHINPTTKHIMRCSLQPQIPALVRRKGIPISMYDMPQMEPISPVGSSSLEHLYYEDCHWDLTGIKIVN